LTKFGRTFRQTIGHMCHSTNVSVINKKKQVEKENIYCLLPALANSLGVLPNCFLNSWLKYFRSL